MQLRIVLSPFWGPARGTECRFLGVSDDPKLALFVIRHQSEFEDGGEVFELSSVVDVFDCVCKGLWHGLST